MKLSPHFTLAEMTYSKTSLSLQIPNQAPQEVIANLTYLCVNALEPIRAHFGLPVRVNSGYRSKALNRAIGGSKTSQHVVGEAADIEIPGVSNYQLAVYIHANLEFDQLILENHHRDGDPASGWVHVSLKDSNNRKQSLEFTKGKYKSWKP